MFGDLLGAPHLLLCEFAPTKIDVLFIFSVLEPNKNSLKQLKKRELSCHKMYS